MERFIFSDHCPTALICKVTDVPSLMLIYKCSKDIFSYDHLDVNRRILPPLKINRMDITKGRFLLKKGAADVKEKIAENLVDNNTLCNIISNTIYIACKDSYKDTQHQDVPDIEPNLTNCNSENFKAIHHHSFNVSVPLKVGRTAPMFVLSFFLHSILLAGSALDSFQCLRSLLIVSFHVFFGLPRPRCPTTSNSVMLLIQPSFLTTYEFL